MVLPLTREWIEMLRNNLGKDTMHGVLPLTREWIEIPLKKKPL